MALENRLLAVIQRIGAESKLLRNRANHSGTQVASTISDFTEATQDVVGAFVAATSGTGVTATYNDAGNVETLVGPLVSGRLPVAALAVGVTRAARGATRPDSDQSSPVIFINATPVPIVVPPSLAGMYDGIDIQIKTAN